MKNHIDEKEATEELQRAGWTSPQIQRLRELRRDYIDRKGRQAAGTHGGSAFVRWLLALLQEGFGPSSPWC